MATKNDYAYPAQIAATVTYGTRNATAYSADGEVIGGITLAADNPVLAHAIATRIAEHDGATLTERKE